MPAIEVKIKDEFIKLDSFLKFCGEVCTGGEGKNLILDGQVSVNGEVCLMRGKKIRIGDKVEVGGEKYLVVGD
jgi:ribosome-associated protein